MQPFIFIFTALLLLANAPAGGAAPLYADVSASTLPLGVLGGNSMDVEMADLDQDGDLDIVIACEFCTNLLLINDGGGLFSDESSSRLPQPQPAHDSEDIALADFNRDGQMDILFVSEDDQINELYFGNKGSFTDETSRLNTNGISNAVLAVDVDHDRDLDIMIGNAGANVLLINNGSGNFSDESAIRLPANGEITQDLEAGDVDGDHKVDIIVGNENGNRLWLNSGSGVFVDATPGQLPLVTGEETREADLGDIDSDGDLDLVFANVHFAAGSTGRNRLLRNDGCGVFTDISAAALPVFNLNTVDADFLDVDGDADLDLLLSTAFDGTFQVFTNDGKGNFSDATTQVLPATANGNGVDIEAGDVNRDSAADLYLGIFGGTDKLLTGSVIVESLFQEGFEGAGTSCPTVTIAPSENAGTGL